jgi:hypothetical protein
VCGRVRQRLGEARATSRRTRLGRMSCLENRRCNEGASRSLNRRRRSVATTVSSRLSNLSIAYLCASSAAFEIAKRPTFARQELRGVFLALGPKALKTSTSRTEWVTFRLADHTDTGSGSSALPAAKRTRLGQSFQSWGGMQ